jgi:hypothetical protein
MVRHARWILVALMTFGVVGAAYACDHAKDASASKGSCTKSAAVQTASAHSCTAAEKAACEAKMAKMTPAEKAASEARCQKMAAAHADCEYCQMVAEWVKNQDKVTVTTVENENGVTLVFAAVNPQDVEAAQQVASKAYALFNAPAHCSFTRSEMAKEDCIHCKEAVGAFANASVTLKDTENGATAQVEAKDKEQVAKLRTFFENLEATKS